MRKLCLFFFLLVPLFFVKQAQASYPDYKSYVNDNAHVLPDETRERIDQKLSDLDVKTSIQIAVLTIDSTEPEDIEEYSIHLADKWKVGQVKLDNGVIMVFAMKDRKMRIEVGRGLEGVLTDIQAKHILDDVIKPKFKQGNYSQGIEDGVNAVIATILPSATGVPAAQTSPDNVSVAIFIIILIAIIVFIALSPHTPFGGAGVWGLPMFWGRVGKDDDDRSGFGGFGGGGFSGGGASSDW